MVNTCVDAYLRKLIRIEHYVKNIYLRRRFIDGWEDWYSDVLDQVQTLKLELRFLKMFLWRFSTSDDTNLHDSRTSSQKILYKFMCCFATREEDTNVLMVCWRSTTHSSIEAIWEKIGGAQIAVADPFLAILQPERNRWEVFASRIERAIQHCKPLVEENCERFLDCSMKCKCLKSNEILQYLDIILENLKDLVRYKAAKIVSLKKQIEALEGRVMLHHNFFKLLTSNGCSLDSMNLRDFKSYVVTFASNAASLMFLYWAKAVDEETVTNMSLFDRLQKIIKPGVPEVMVLYFDALRAIKLERFDDTLLLGQVVANSVDHLLENRVAPMKDDDFQALRDGLIFLLTFRADPPTRCKDLILMCNEIDVLLSEGSGLILQLDYMTEDSDKGKIGLHLSDFVTKIEILKDRIIQRYVRIPDSSLLHFPVTNGLGFLDFLMQNLRDMKEKLDSDSTFIPFAKNHVIKIEEELVTLRPFLNDFPELQNELKVTEDTWLKVINLAYLTEHVINLCSIKLYPIWYNISYLSYVVKQITLLNGKTEKIKECKMYRNGDISSSPEILSEQDSYSRTNEEVVGFEAEADILIEKLRWGGYKSFDIVSIVGMPGIGKTTMARKVCSSPIVRHHFNIFAFCTVSQVHNIRKLFLDILRDIIILDAKILSMTEHDLAHQLRKCLSGQRYLIVMDDMWDVSAWNEVKSSFPEDNNGSRVLITTRSHKVASNANGGSPHILRLLSDDNSWELLQKKVFGKEDCPQNLSEVGKVIAKNCKGLPLAVVLVAGLLSRTGKSRSSWSKIAETTCSYASMEGCRDMIELSYKHLPEYLKPCFLYFGAFSEDEAISAKRLMMLWIAEGFVPKSETRSVENVAREYLNDLVDRSLVIVFKRSSCGGISTCGVHDLLHDFCQTKAKDENFSHLIRGSSVSSNSSSSPTPNFYRVSIQTNWRSYLEAEAEATSPNTHSLLYCHELDTNDNEKFNVRSLKLVQVLNLGKIILNARDFHCITSLVHLKYFAVSTSDLVSVPSSISNLYNLETFILIRRDALYGPVSMLLPNTIWRMKRLRYVDVGIVHFDLNGDLEDDEAYINEGDSFHVLDNVQRFSSLTLSCRSATSVELDGDGTDLLKRLPNVQELSCCLDESWESVLTFELLSKLESLKLYSHCSENPSVIFPSNLKKLTLSGFGLSWSGFSAIGKLPFLEVLKILDNSEKRWETEDAEFPNLKFLKLMDLDLEIWNASVDSFPCLERLVLNVCKNLVKIPASFGNLVTLKSIEVYMCNNGVATSAVEIQDEQMNYGNELQLIISNYFED